MSSTYGFIYARNPGSMWCSSSQWFEQNLHSTGFIQRVRRGLR